MHKLLIVEDEPLIRKGIRTLIDYDTLNISDCFEAENGLIALQIFDENMPDLVLLDINLPKINGLDVAVQMKAKNPNVKIAILTGYDYFDYAVAALKTGVDDYVLKPVSKKDITEILSKLASKAEAESLNKALSNSVDDLLKINIVKDDGYKSEISNIIAEELSNTNLSLTYLASKLGLSPGYLSNLFKQQFGIPFQDYVLGQRLDKAKLLLLSSNAKIYEIAEAVGFEDVNYFSTRFKKRFGYSPKQFLQNVRFTNEDT